MHAWSTENEVPRLISSMIDMDGNVFPLLWGPGNASCYPVPGTVIKTPSDGIGQGDSQGRWSRLRVAICWTGASMCCKVRCVIQGFREMCSLLDGADFCYASDIAGLSAVRSLVFDPIAKGSDMTISSCDIAQAFLQSDKFPESDPARFLKVRDPITKQYRYFRQWGVLYGSKSSSVRWQRTLHPLLESIGFQQGHNEPCAFFHPERKIRLLSYVDDLLTKASRADAEKGSQAH